MGVFVDGVEQSGGGSGSGSGVSTAWSVAVDADFTALSDVDLIATGDGNKTIDSKTWTLVNSAKASAVDVGTSAGGLTITVPVATIGKLYENEAKEGCYLYSKLAQFLAGTDAEGRPDVELRITARTTYTGAPANTYEGLVHGISTPTLDANYHTWLHQGNYASGASGFDRFRAKLPGTISGGLLVITELTTPALAYIPNVVRMSILSGNLWTAEYSDAAAASIDAAVMTPSVWNQGSITNSLLLNEGASAAGKEAMFYFGINKYYATGGLTSMTLQQLRIEWRFSPRGDVVFLA